MGKYVWVVFFTNLNTIRAFPTPQAAYDAMRDYLFEISSSDEEFHDMMDDLIENYNWNYDYFGDNCNCHAEKVEVEVE